MGRCLTVAFIVSGVLLASVALILYTPLPPDVANRWQLQMLNAKMKAAFIYGELQYRFGVKDRLPAIRAALNQTLNIPLTQETRAGLEIYDTNLNGVPVRIYKPKSAEGPLPGIVFYHGGGWNMLDVSFYDGLCGHIAKASNIVVISVEYRLAPEHPFPAGFEDCVQVALYALKNGEKIGLDPTRVAVGGDSSGGNLAAAVSIKLRNDKVKPALKAQLLIYGCYQFCDTTLPIWKKRDPYDPQAVKMFAFFFGTYFNFTEAQNELLMSNKYLTPDMQRKCDKFVDYTLLPKDLLPENHARGDQIATAITDDVKYINSLMDDLRVAPLMVQDLSNLPSSFVLAVGWDGLRDENIIYAERLKIAGNTVKLLFLPDSFHGILNAFDFDTFGFDAGPKAMSELLAYLEKELK